MMKPALKKLLAGGALVLFSLLLPAVGSAQEGAGGGGKNQIIALAAAIAISIAAAGGGLGQGRVAASAFDGMARNPSIQPKIFTAMILGLAFIESLVIYAMLVSFLLMAKI
jgi:F-type H+-transporting ATPase subunit c